MTEDFHLVVMGAPGSGKGTQADLLAEKFDFRHIQTGEIYRTIAKQDTEIGRKVKAYLDKGELVDDETTFQAIDEHLHNIRGRLILDGYPRTLVQAEKEVIRVDLVIYIKVDDPIVISRMLNRKRQGETEELIKKRIQVYHLQTEPVLGYYRKLGKLKEIDGNGTIEEVNKLILAAVDD